MKTLAKFDELGIKVQSIVKVNSRFHISWDSKEHEIIPALFTKVE